MSQKTRQGHINPYYGVNGIQFVVNSCAPSSPGGCGGGANCGGAQTQCGPLQLFCKIRHPKLAASASPTNSHKHVLSHAH